MSWWSNYIRCWDNLVHLEGTGFQDCLRPWWRNHLRFWVNLQHLEALNSKIFFNYGKEITCVLSQIAAFGRTEFQNFLQPWWRNQLHFWVNLGHLERLNFKIFFNYGEEITSIFKANLDTSGPFSPSKYSKLTQKRNWLLHHGRRKFWNSVLPKFSKLTQKYKSFLHHGWRKFWNSVLPNAPKLTLKSWANFWIFFSKF